MRRQRRRRGDVGIVRAMEECVCEYSAILIQRAFRHMRATRDIVFL